MHRPKNKVSVTSLGGYRQRADNPNPSTDPTTEKDSFNTENNTAGQYPLLCGITYILIEKHLVRFYCVEIVEIGVFSLKFLDNYNQKEYNM